MMDLRRCVDDLMRDGRLSQQDANIITSKTRTREQSAMHPLAYIATLKLTDRQPGKQQASPILDDNVLCQWLSDKSQLPLFHIDPLKVNVTLCHFFNSPLSSISFSFKSVML